MCAEVPPPLLVKFVGCNSPGGLLFASRWMIAVHLLSHPTIPQETPPITRTSSSYKILTFSCEVIRKSWPHLQAATRQRSIGRSPGLNNNFSPHIMQEYSKTRPGNSKRQKGNLILDDPQHDKLLMGSGYSGVLSRRVGPSRP